MTILTRRRGARLTTAALVAAVLLGMLWSAPSAPSASAQAPDPSCDPLDPYGCTDTTLPGVIATSTCQITVTSAAPGTVVALTITNVPEGLAVSLVFNGTIVATQVAGQDNTGSGLVDVPFSFTVPQVAPGNYSLVAVGAGFASECLRGTGFRVVEGATTPRSTGGGSLARTGFTVLGLLLLAALLVLVGRVLVESSRRHRASPHSG